MECIAGLCSAVKNENLGDFWMKKKTRKIKKDKGELIVKGIHVILCGVLLLAYLICGIFAKDFEGTQLFLYVVKSLIPWVSAQLFFIALLLFAFAWEDENKKQGLQGVAILLLGVGLLVVRAFI